MQPVTPDNFGDFFQGRVLVISCGLESGAGGPDSLAAVVEGLEKLYADAAFFLALDPSHRSMLGANAASPPFVTLFRPTGWAGGVFTRAEASDLPEALAALVANPANPVADPDPDDPEALMTAGRAADAIAVWKSRVEADPDDREAWRGHARALFHIGRDGEGHAVLDAALQHFPADPELLADRAGEYVAAYQFAEGLAAWRAVAERTPDDPWAWLGIARCLEEMAEEGGAEAVKRALALDPELEDEVRSDPAFEDLLDQLEA